MTIRSTAQSLITILLLTATGSAEPASATEVRVVSRAPAAPIVVYRRASLWETIPGTRVAWVRDADRPAYDLFRYGSRYYIYNDGYWYSSRRQNGRYVVIDDRRVPIAIAGVPDHHWRTYPQGWKNPKHPHYYGKHDKGKHKGHSSNGKH